ncbi:HTH domain-containing protein [uncultured Fusobacterium sp.]|uniref:HTH domain-containing protein n=1 Tax=uncultured Fusobacterium sp. TaxID=159267 RepID=UPI0034D586E2
MLKEKILKKGKRKKVFLWYLIIKKYPSAKQKDVMEGLNISRRTLERVISTLKENNYIERIGSNRSGYWKILK